MSKPDGSLSAVVVSGGKQYRVAPGDRILVDRLAAEPGSSVKLGRVLLLVDGSDIKVGGPAIEGLDVDAKVIAHRRGPRIENLRYKSKKRVRVHRGGRADLTALEILAVGGMTGKVEVETAAPTKTKERKPKRGAAPEVEDDAKGEAPAEGNSESTTEAKADAPTQRTARKPKSPKENG